ncbi:MAG: cytochrome c oxidase subunit II [Myxococcaceae bacterium]
MRRSATMMTVTAVLLALCGCKGAQDSLDAAGPQAQRFGSLFWLFFWVTGIAFGITLIVLAISLLKRGPRATIEPELEPMPQDYGPSVRPIRPLDIPYDRKMVRVITGASFVTVILLFVLLIASVSTGHAMSSLDEKDALDVTIIGRQWWWEIHYPNANDPSQEVVTANELHIPAGRTIRVKLISRDVIHSFWVPNLDGKLDLIPGYVNQLKFRVDSPTHLRGQCAEFCGLQHAHMGLEVFADSPENFEKWLMAQRLPAPEPQTAELQRGREVFVHGPCGMCHTISGTDAAATIGPNLTHLKSRTTLAAGTLPNNKGDLGGWILNSQAIKPGVQMPSINLSAQDFQALLNYLETLQ